MTAASSFDLCGPLPSGTTVLEASAGTGKTFTMAALVARYVAEGISLSALLMVTFSRAATTELRVRVRARLAETTRDLLAVVSGRITAPEISDSVSRLLATGSPEEVSIRARRLSVALRDFDDATIATTHEFCARMLTGLGILGQADPARVFAESLSDLSDEVAADIFLRLYGYQSSPPISIDETRTLARSVTHHPHCVLVPDADDAPVAVQARVRIAHAVRKEVQRRQHFRRIVTHDDFLVSLRDSLAHPDHGAAAADLLQERFRVVLIDEFQDTDPIQWDIVQRAFVGASTVILIGDPKQAIYAFRGADLHSYLEAVTQADQHFTLDTNWRSDAAMVGAVDHLFAGAALGDTRIQVTPVAAHHQQRRLRSQSSAWSAPIRLRFLGGEKESVKSVRPVIQADLVDQVVQMLSDGTEICDEGQWRTLQPSDIAVLVTKNDRAEEICAALATAGVPAVLAGASTVLTSEMAQHWSTVLQALIDPRNQTIRRAALTPMVGWTFSRLATADDEAIGNLNVLIRRWAAIANQQGIAALTEAIIGQARAADRLLAQPEGERHLTDLRHLGQLLQSHADSQGCGLPALAEWLNEAINAAQRSGEDEQSRRLETDAQAIQVVTVHRAKGLEFGVVLLPDLWDHWVGRDEGRPFDLHDPGTGELILDIGGLNGRDRSQRYQAKLSEEAGERLRLLYVALTRARHGVLAWWARTATTDTSPLHRILGGPRIAGLTPPESVSSSIDPDQLSLDATHVAVSRIDPDQIAPDPQWKPPRVTDPDLHYRQFTRSVDGEWRRTSYSGLTAAAHSASARRVDDVAEVDETEVESLAGLASVPGADVVSPMGQLPAGAEFGTIMHAIFEHAESSATDLGAELLARTHEQLARLSYPVDAATLAQALEPAFRTPLGPLANEQRLIDYARRDRLAELEFELPLAGGLRPHSHIYVRDIAALLREHLPPDHPLADYPHHLGEDPTGPQSLRGFLTGSIDSVLRHWVDDQPRHLVVDYKSNWLGDFGGELTLADYHPDRMAQAMMHAHYPLQALLYSVALHRYLRWRLPGYDPQVHLGGIAYLFVRGMAGPDTPRANGVPYGVFSWDPGTDLVLALSQLLTGGNSD